MAATCVEKIGHEECGSSDALQVYYDRDTGEFNGYCFSCNTYIAEPYGTTPEKIEATHKISKPKDPAELRAEVARLDRFPVSALPTRKLRQDTLEYYGCKVGLSEADGATVTEVYFPFTHNSEVVRYKCKLIEPKKMWWVGPSLDNELFGWKQALASGGKRLFITEGEEDALALYQVLKDGAKGKPYADNDPAVCSLRNGSGSAGKEMGAQAAEIRRNFKEVVLVLDQDEQGKEAVRKILDVMPEAMECGALPAKDANDCLKKGFSKGLTAAVLFKAAIPKNTTVVDLWDYVDEARVAPVMGMSWPFPTITELTRGIRYGETYYLGAGVKMGKSSVLNTLATHLVIEHDQTIFMAKPEEALNKSVRLIQGQLAGRFFHDPTVEFDYEAYDKAKDRWGPGRILGMDNYQHLPWNHLRSEIMVAYHQGARCIFIDPITNITNGIASSDANTLLQEVSQEVAAMAQDLELAVFLFCHLKAPEWGPGHERGGRVFSHQFAGSRAMMRSCHFMLGLEGNKDPQLDKYERNIRNLSVLEDREFGSSGTASLYWDENTGWLKEVPYRNISKVKEENKYER
jgi:twinkle protein